MKTRVTIALAGNPNAGKTSIFNHLTGGRQHVGNWPGVTVDIKEGAYEFEGADVRVVDLPGTYSLGAYTPDEIAARDYVLADEADVVVDVVDASNLERNLYLTTQLLEIGANVVVALNMYDVAEKEFNVDLEKLTELLGVPVVPTVGTSGRGVPELKAAIAAAAGRRTARPLELHYGSELEPHLQDIAGDVASLRGFSPALRPRWTALRLLEGDEGAKALLQDIPGGEAVVAEASAMSEHLKRVIGDDAEVAIADHRYGFIRGLMREAVAPRGPSPERLTASDKTRIQDTAECATHLSLTQVVGVLSGADAFLGNDSGVTHLAAVMGLRTFALFGPTDPAFYRPLGRAVTVFQDTDSTFAERPSASFQQHVLESLISSV